MTYHAINVDAVHRAAVHLVVDLGGPIRGRAHPTLDVKADFDVAGAIAEGTFVDGAGGHHVLELGFV